MVSISTLFIRSFIICNLIVSHLIAMDANESILTTKQGYVASKTRFELLQTLLKDNPSLTMTTRIPSKNSLWKLYEADKNFIKTAISDRDNANILNQHFQLIEKLAKERKWDESMSISDLMLIGKLWVTVLGYTTGTFNPAYTETPFTFYDKTLEALKTKIQNDPHTSWYDHALPWVSNMVGFVLPHVSPNGTVPIPNIVKTTGFFVQDGSANYLDLWAVPTNITCSFDYFLDQKPGSSWHHDSEHTSRSERLSGGENVRIYTRKSANLYRELEKKLNEEQWKLINLAHYHIFHERQQLVINLEKFIADEISTIQEILNQKEIIPEEDFDSIEQFNNYIKGAESLKISLTGETTIEKYRSYREKELEGLQLLQQHVTAYDGYTG